MAIIDWRTVPWVGLPRALAELHHSLPPGAVAAVRFPGAGVAPADRPPAMPGLSMILEGAGFAQAAAPARSPRRQAASTAPAGGPRLAGAGGMAGDPGAAEGAVHLERLRTLPDTVGPAMRALVCGLNPSLVAADAGFGFAGATNRFWNAALASGLVRAARRPLEALAQDGIGMTDAAKRATARSQHLARAEYQSGFLRLEALSAWLAPKVVIFVGLEGWRAARDRHAQPGWQAGGIGGCPAYLMPSTSGANARTPPAALAVHLRTALAGPAVPPRHH